MNLEPIDTSTTAGKARIMQLAAEGRQLAVRDSNDPLDPFDATMLIDVYWDWRNYDYAIIAEPVGPGSVWVRIENGYPVGVWNNSVAPEAIAGTEVVRFIRADLAGEMS